MVRESVREYVSEMRCGAVRGCGVVWWCGGAVVRRCGGAVVRWCGGVVVWWCGGVVRCGAARLPFVLLDEASGGALHRDGEVEDEGEDGRLLCNEGNVTHVVSACSMGTNHVAHRQQARGVQGRVRHACCGMCLYHEWAEEAHRTNLAICTPVMHGACNAGEGVTRGAEAAWKGRGGDDKGGGNVRTARSMRRYPTQSRAKTPRASRALPRSLGGAFGPGAPV